VPGACAAVAGLAGAGLPTDAFTFAGFLPKKSKARTERLTALAPGTPTLIMYGACATPTSPSLYSDEKVANRDIRVWHGATENGP
jgi:hypothetical protein